MCNCNAVLSCDSCCVMIVELCHVTELLCHNYDSRAVSCDADICHVTIWPLLGCSVVWTPYRGVGRSEVLCRG